VFVCILCCIIRGLCRPISALPGVSCSVCAVCAVCCARCVLRVVCALCALCAIYMANIAYLAHSAYLPCGGVFCVLRCAARVLRVHDEETTSTEHSALRTHNALFVFIVCIRICSSIVTYKAQVSIQRAWGPHKH